MKISEKILAESKNGNVVINTPLGLRLCKIEDIVNQPVDGLLYDLNRDEATIMTFIDSEKWINDSACALVIRYLMNKLNSK